MQGDGRQEVFTVPASPALTLEEIVTAVYCALDDALTEANVICRDGKLIWRPGPPPEMDDREVLCLAVLQELLDYESDNAYCLWLANNATIRALFPKLLTRQKFAERRALLTPLIQRLSQAFCVLDGEGSPPFVSSIRTRSTSANSCAANNASAWASWQQPAIVLH
jgi:hypothetical protein